MKCIAQSDTRHVAQELQAEQKQCVTVTDGLTNQEPSSDDKPLALEQIQEKQPDSKNSSFVALTNIISYSHVLV